MTEPRGEAGGIPKYRFNDPPYQRVELRRLTLSWRWIRNDPLTVLSPGTEVIEEVVIECGLSQEKSRELSASLGLPISTPIGTLSANLAARLNQKITLTGAEKHRDPTPRCRYVPPGWADRQRQA